MRQISHAQFTLHTQNSNNNMKLLTEFGVEKVAGLCQLQGKYMGFANVKD